MTKTTAITRIAALAIMLGILPGLATARQLPHEDNIWRGKAHQPTKPEVAQQEQAAGAALPPKQQHSANRDVETLYRSLMQGEPGK